MADEDRDSARPTLGELWKSARTPADYASIVAGGTLGLAVDTLVFAHSGVPTPTATVIGAGGLYSFKKSLDAARDARKRRNQIRKAVKRARELVADFKAAGYDAGAATLQTQLEWCEKGTIDPDELAGALKPARDEFLAWQRASRDQRKRPDTNENPPPTDLG